MGLASGLGASGGGVGFGGDVPEESRRREEARRQLLRATTAEMLSDFSEGGFSDEQRREFASACFYQIRSMGLPRALT